MPMLLRSQASPADTKSFKFAFPMIPPPCRGSWSAMSMQLVRAPLASSKTSRLLGCRQLPCLFGYSFSLLQVLHLRVRSAHPAQRHSDCCLADKLNWGSMPSTEDGVSIATPVCSRSLPTSTSPSSSLSLCAVISPGWRCPCFHELQVMPFNTCNMIKMRMKVWKVDQGRHVHQTTCEEQRPGLKVFS